MRYKELVIEMRSDRSDIGKFCIECVYRGNILALLRSKRVLKYERCSQYLVSKWLTILFSCTLSLAQRYEVGVINQGDTC